MRKKLKDFWDDVIYDMWDWLFAHETLVKVVSTVFGSILGVWLNIKFMSLLIDQVR